MRTTIWVVMLALGACASADKPVGGDKTAIRPAHEVVSGGARIRGGNIRMDVTVGGPVAPHAPTARPAGVVTP